MNVPRLLAALSWILPPLLGALIGFVTNALAIRMLFRPLRAYRILGLRIPFTPGIIPRQRHQLALSIAAMVSRELLTEDAITSQVSRPEFAATLLNQISRTTDDLLDRPISELVPRQWNRPGGTDPADPGSAPVAIMARSIEALLNRVLISPGFMNAVRTVVGELVSWSHQIELGSLIGDLDASRLVDQRLAPALERPATRKVLAEFIAEWLRSRQTVGAVIPAEIATSKAVTGAVERAVPLILERLILWLDEPENRRELQHRGRAILRDVLDRLNVFQRFMVSAGQYDRTLEERMPEIIDDVVRRVRDASADPALVGRIGAALIDGIEAFRSRRWDEVLGDDIDGAVGAGVDTLVATLAGDGGRRMFTAVIERLLETGGGLTVGGLVARISGASDVQLVERMTAFLLTRLSDPATATALAARAGSLLGSLLEDRSRTLRELLAPAEETKRAVDRFATDRISEALAARIPALLAGLDVEQMVIDKIDSLDVVAVERIITGVIAQQLKWINLFGAVLGAFIGVSQLLLRLITP